MLSLVTSVSSKPVSIRFNLDDWEEWKAMARTQGVSFNKYVVRAVRGQYELDKAESLEQKEQIAERERVKSVAFPQGPKSCNHVVKGQWCYQCNEKKW